MNIFFSPNYSKKSFQFQKNICEGTLIDEKCTKFHLNVLKTAEFRQCECQRDHFSCCSVSFYFFPIFNFSSIWLFKKYFKLIFSRSLQTSDLSKYRNIQKQNMNFDIVWPRDPEWP